MKWITLVLPLFLPMLLSGYTGTQEPFNTPTPTLTTTSTPTPLIAATETPTETPTPTPFNTRYLFDPEYFCDDYQVIVNPQHIIDFEVCVRYRLIDQKVMYMDIQTKRKPVGLEGYTVYYQGHQSYEGTAHPHFTKREDFYNLCYLGPIDENGYATCRIPITCTVDKPLYYTFNGVTLRPPDPKTEMMLTAPYWYTYAPYKTEQCN